MTIQRYSSEQSPSTFRKECNHLTANFLVKCFSVYIPSQYKKKEEKTQHDISNVTEHIVKRTAMERYRASVSKLIANLAQLLS